MAISICTTSCDFHPQNAPRSADLLWSGDGLVLDRGFLGRVGNRLDIVVADAHCPFPLTSGAARRIAGLHQS